MGFWNRRNKDEPDAERDIASFLGQIVDGDLELVHSLNRLQDNYTAAAARNAAQRDPVAFGVLDAAAGTVAQLRLIDTEGKTSPLLDQLNTAPNPAETFFEFTYRLVVTLMISPKGAFALYAPMDLDAGLWLLPPDLVQKKQLLGQPVPEYRVASRPLPPTLAILHFRRPDPISLTKAFAPFRAAAGAVDIDAGATEQISRRIATDGRTGKVLWMSADVDDTKGKNLRRRISGAGKHESNLVEVLTNMQKAGVLDISTPLDAALYAAAREQGAGDLTLATGTPRVAMGDASGNIYQNSEGEMSAWIQFRLSATLALMSDGFSRLFPPGWELTYDTSTLMAVRRTQALMARDLLPAVGTVISPNELRELCGLGRIDRPEMDDIPGRFAFNVGTQLSRPLVKASAPRARARRERFIHRAFDAMFDEWIALAIAAVERSLPTLDTPLDASAPTPQVLAALIDIDVDTLARITTKVAYATLRAIYADIGYAFAQVFGTVFDADTAPLQAAIRARTTQLIHPRTGQGIPESFAQMVRDRVAHGISEGMSGQQITSYLGEVLGEWKRHEAATIARTEVTSAHTVTVLEAGRQDPDHLYTKTWLTGDDDRVREEHLELHGMTVPMADPFPTAVGPVDGPGTSGDPGFDVGCRCEVAPGNDAVSPEEYLLEVPSEWAQP